MSRRRLPLAAIAVWLAGILGFSAAEAAGPRQSVLLETEPVAVRRLEAAREHLKVGQWEEAVPLLRQAAELHGETWVPVEPGRFLPVQTCCDMLLATLPKEALIEHRRRIDPQAKRWFESGAAARDEALLGKVVRQAFVSSYGDDALWLLGELAFERGDLSRARSCWLRLLPAAAADPDAWPLSAAYPDSNLDPALIRARLVLCSALRGLPGVQQELADFAQRHSEARGSLAGRTGVLGQILADVIQETQTTERTPQNSDTATFAGNAERNKMLPRTYDLGGRLWSIGLRRHPASLDPRESLPTYFPAVVGNIVVLCDESSIYAIDLYRGVPAFPLEDEPQADADDAGLDPALLKCRVYKLPPESRPRGGVQADVVGVPAFTVTIDQGRIYARLGSVSRRHDIDSKRSARSFLVCLDLAREAAHLATLDSDTLTNEGVGWTFEGAPVVGQERVYVALRRHKPQPQLAVACFDALLQRHLWTRSVCLGASNVAGEGVEISQQLLTLEGDRLYYNTNLGAIAALDAHGGAPLWVTTYEHLDLTANELPRLHRQGPNPCLVHEDTVFAAPFDSTSVLALEADTGRIRWQRSFRGEELNLFARRASGPHCLLGVSDQKLIAAGEELWTLDIATGAATQIGHDDPDPALHVFGRGLLAAGTVYTTSREILFVRDAATGRVDRLPANAPSAVNRLVEHEGTGGGNLLLARGALLIAQPDRLTAFSDLATLRKRKQDEVAQKSNSPESVMELGLIEAGLGLSNEALVRFREVRRSTRIEVVWEGLPLETHAARSEFDLLWETGTRLDQARQPADAAAKYLEAFAAAASPHPRRRALLAAAQSFRSAGRPADAVAALQRLLDEAGGGKFREASSGPGRTAEDVARVEISRMVALHGVSAYSAVEKRASGALQAALAARNPDAIAGALRQFPNAAGADAARSTLIDLHLDRGEPARALAAADEQLAIGRDPAGAPLALIRKARIEERLQYWASAARTWKLLAQKFPAAPVPENGAVIAAREFVPKRLADPEFHPAAPAAGAAGFLRRWRQPLAESGRAVVPAGLPPDPSAACVLVHSPQLSALGLRDGRPRWSTPVNDLAEWSGFLGSWLVIGHRRGVFAVETSSGRIAWEQTLAETPVTAFRADEQRVVCLSADGTLTAIDGVRGGRIWSYRPKGLVQPCWQASAGRVIVQTLRPPQTLVLSATDGMLLASRPGAETGWLADPVPIGSTALAVVTEPQTVQVLDARSALLRWEQSGPGRPAFDRTVALAAGQDVLIVRDGTTVTRLNLAGQPQWLHSVRLGPVPLAGADEVLCVDAQRLFVPVEGVLRCIELSTGRLAWEQVLGEASGRWRVERVGDALAVWPLNPVSQPVLVVLDPATGGFVQRIPLESQRNPVLRTQDTLLVMAGNALVAFKATD